jgi:hypothetical protein
VLGERRDRVRSRSRSAAASLSDRETPLLCGGELREIAGGKAARPESVAAAIDHRAEAKPAGARGSQESRERSADLAETEKHDVGAGGSLDGAAADFR